MQQWYALQAKPHREFFANSAVASIEGVETYLPCLSVKPVNPRARTTRPFFPGYLFAYADLQRTGLSSLQYVPGVARIISYGDVPVVIPAAVIDEIRTRVGQVQRQDPAGLGRYRHGDRVRITAGPFAGYEAIFDTCLNGQQRARLLVEFLGRLTVAELDVRHITEASARPS